MPQGLRQSVPVPSGAGQRVGHAAGGDNDRPAGIPPPLSRDSGQGLPIPRQRESPVLNDVHPRPPQGPKQGVDDIRRFIGAGKHPIAPFGFQRDPQFLKERLGPLRRKPGHGADEEAVSSGNILQGLRRSAVVGHVAAPLAGDVQLPAQLGVALQQSHRRPGLRRRICGHTARRAAANHHHVRGAPRSGRAHRGPSTFS